MLCKKISVCLFALVLGLMAVSQASADIVAYTNEAAFNAAITDATTQGWGITSDPQSLGSDYVYQGIEILGSNMNGTNNGFSGAWGTGLQMVQPNGISAAHLYGYDPGGANAMTALGAKVYGYGTTYGAPLSVEGTVKLSDNSTQAFSIAYPATKSTAVFLGFVSTDPSKTIYVMDFSADSSTAFCPTVGAVTYGNAVPEPTALVLLGSGLLGLLAYAWRKRK